MSIYPPPNTHYYILDSKIEGSFDNFPGIVQTDGGLPPAIDQKLGIQVWQPILEVEDEIEEWLFRVRKDPPAILLIDELVTLVYSKTRMSMEYSRLQKLGRTLPVSVISCTQELTQIPRNAIGQATHIARFRLQMPYEQQLMNMLLQEKVNEPVDKYGFFYGPNDGNPLYFPTVDDFLSV